MLKSSVRQQKVLDVYQQKISLTLFDTPCVDSGAQAKQPVFRMLILFESQSCHKNIKVLLLALNAAKCEGG